MISRRAGLRVAAALVGCASLATGQTAPIRSGTLLFAVGAGAVDSWDTKFEVGSGGAARIRVGIHPPPSVCALICDPAAVVIETPEGTLGTVLASEIPGGTGVQTFSIFKAGEDDMVRRSVRATARIVNRARPEQAADLPLVDYRTLWYAQPAVTERGRDVSQPTLSFPVRREAGRHTNLVVASIEAGEVFFLRVDFLDATGTIIRTFGPRGSMHTGATIHFRNVLSTLPDDFEGWIRITRQSSQGLLWATLANVYADGRLELLAPTTGMSSTQPIPGGDP